ncbi:hypothetical protein CHL76_07390 [Marinococcus halophilus]|uniref:Uncharacterized protein n=1 Tax=Marinococcus halophilus TaxID=1371 RepID=A0A510Y4W5_MARHA|nr:hypothetical protein [Marinococcus halophilus]OZT80345.1 hypothetical protein CHL76_07390 [Marinococcus halophilus]GEK58406.1 hypothetical protein MHA01_13110 [Marinococcus halophilus]
MKDRETMKKVMKRVVGSIFIILTIVFIAVGIRNGEWYILGYIVNLIIFPAAASVCITSSFRQGHEFYC